MEPTTQTPTQPQAAPTGQAPTGQAAPQQFLAQDGTTVAPGQTAQPVQPGTDPVAQPDLKSEPAKPASDWLLDMGLDEDKPVLDADGKPLLAGKYKDVPELEKAYKELQQQFSKLTAVPEKYDIADTLKANQLEFRDGAHEQAVLQQFKDARYSQEQVNIGLKMYRDAMTQVLAQYGPPVNPQVEMQSLRREWGDQFDARNRAVNDFVKSGQLPKEALTTPLGKSAAGMQLLWKLTQQNFSPTVVKSDKGGRTDVSAMRTELSKMQGDPKYYADPKIQEAAQALHKQITEIENTAY